MFKKENLPRGWEIKNLSEICDVRDGTHDSPKYKSEGYPLITSKNVAKGFIDFSEVNLISKEDYDKFNKRSYVDDGDILMPMIGTIGNPIIVKKEREFAIKNVALIKFTETDVSNKYIKLFLESIHFKHYIKRINRGGTQKFISLKDIRNFPVILPPLETQKKIVEILEKAEKLKEWRAEADELADEYSKSVFLEMFGHSGINPKNWPLMKAEEICSKEKHAIKAGPFGSSLKKEFYVEKGYKIYGQEQVIKDDLSFGDYYIPEKIYKKLENCKIKEGDILISLVGSYGKISIVPTEFEPGIINPRLMKISLNQKIILPLFFKFLLNSEGIKKRIQQVSHGGTMAIINVKIIKELEFPIPPIELQNQFTDIVHQFEEIKTHQTRSKQEIDNLFNTLMQKAFKGELVC